MNLSQSRIGLLVPTPTPIWTGTANGAQSGTFVLAVTTVSGTLTAGMAGLVLVRAGEDLARIKSVAGSTLYLAENSAPFEAGDALAIYELRLPFPRYQRLNGETVYKDWNVAYPATWQHILPPTAVVSPEAAWLRVGALTTFDAQDSRVMAPDATVGVTATWDAAGWATTSAYGSAGGVTNCYCDLTPTTAGFHYLKLTITDEWSGATTHHIPIWVGETYTNILEFSMDWNLGKGWRGSGKTAAQFSYLAHSPVAVVDIETHEIVICGFLSPQSVARTFGTETFSFEILSPVEDARLLQGFPFIVVDIADPGSDVPNNWAEVGELTVARATWHLLVWHTMLPALINIDLGAPESRRIKGQKFPAGSLPGLLDEIVGSAFMLLRSARSGGVALGLHPLYAGASEWATGFTAFTLAAISRREDYDLQLATPQAMDVRLSGVYLAYTGDYLPAICRCPAHPANWGSGGTAEVTNLAPISEAELLLWAGRHFTVENLLPTLSLTADVDVDPFAYELLNTDVPEAPTIAIEEMRLTFSVDGLVWDAGIVGKPYGVGYDAVSVPVPAPIDIPAPTPPPMIPPLDPLPPLPPPCEWPVRLYLASKSRGLYYTTNFSGPIGAQPTWTRLTDTDAYSIKQAAISPITESVFAVCVVATLNELFRWDGSVWENILTDAEATALIGESAAHIGWVHVHTDGVVYAVATGQYTTHLLRSTADGARSGGAHSFVQYGQITGWTSASYIGNLIIKPSGVGMAALNRVGGGNSGRVYTGPAGSDAWERSDSLGISSWGPAVYYDAHNDRIYAQTSTSSLRRLLSNNISWETPAGMIDIVGALGRMSVGFPCFYAWNTNLHVTTGVGDYANAIQWSDDQWETFHTSGDVGRVISMLVGVPTYPGNLLLGRNGAGATGEYHVIYVSADLGATQPVERAGVDPNNTATTVSIPSDCGGIALNGILLPPNYCEAD